jgi:hypothetical protein
MKKRGFLSEDIPASKQSVVLFAVQRFEQKNACLYASGKVPF